MKVIKSQIHVCALLLIVLIAADIPAQQQTFDGLHLGMGNLGSYNFENRETRQYQEFTTPYSGLSQVIRPDGVYQSQQRFGLYRWHILDPIRFEKDLRVTIQALGWKADRGLYLPLQDDIASVAYWYQTEPHAPFPKTPNRDALDIY